MLGFLLSPQKILLKLEERQDLVRYGTSRVKGNTILLVPLIIKTEGQYDFSGSSYHQTLYTNYKFKGKTSYKVYVKNTGKSAITVTAKRLTKTYGSTKISAGKTGSFEFSNIKSDTEFYIVFEAGNEYSFSGYVK